MPAFPRANECPPIGDREIERAKCTRSKDGRSDDDPRSGLVVDHKQRAQSQHQRLQEHAESSRQAAEPAADHAGAQLGGNVGIIVRAPIRGERIRHTHGADHLRIAPSSFGKGKALGAMPGQVPGRGPTAELGNQRDAKKDKTRRTCSKSNPWMEEVANG